MSKNPIISIRDGWLLRDRFAFPLLKYEGREDLIKDDEWYRGQAKKHSGEWAKNDDLILGGMQEILGTNFRQRVFDVYIVPMKGAISHPLIISSDLESDKFVDVLTHELIHNILTANTSQLDPSERIENWSNLVDGDFSKMVLVHILVHSVHKEIYLDYLNDKSRYERDVSECIQRNSVPYVKAWEYVDKTGYEEINKKLHDLYSK